MGTTISYITLGVCAVGCITRILLAGYYKGVVQALKSMKSSRNKTVSALKEQFILRYQAMLGVQNVDYFVGRFLAERKLLGISLVLWNGLHIQLITICLLLGAVASFFMVMQGETTQMVLLTLFHGIWTSTLLLFVDGLCMIPGRITGLRDGLCDYLENYFKVRLEHEYEVWGKNAEDIKQSKTVLEAQLLIADEKGYYRKKKQEERKQRVTRELEQRQANYTAKLERKVQKKREKADRQEAKLLHKQEKERERLLKQRGARDVSEYRAGKEGQARIKEEAAMLKREVEERRRREAEAAASKELTAQDTLFAKADDSKSKETASEQEQVNELLKEFLFR